MRALAVLTVRDEGAFLLEWLSHHRATGFTDFLVFSNDCDDGTDLMLDRLAAMGWLTHVRNTGPHPKGAQWSALKLAEQHPMIAAADWVLVLDIDEFVNIHVGDRTLTALLGALSTATAIPLTWRLFGNCGVIEYRDQPVTATFAKAAPAVLYWPWRAMLFKTLFRNDGTYARLGVHRPRKPDPARIQAQVWYDGSGRALPLSYARSRLFSPLGQDNYALAQLNHYPLGAMESYLVKCARGRANREASGLDMGYWTDRNFCVEEDSSIGAMSSQSAPILLELHDDPQLGRLHQGAVEWRHARFDALMTEEPMRALFGRLLMTPPTRALSKNEAAMIVSHARPSRRT